MKSFLHHLYHYAAYVVGGAVIAVSVIALLLRFLIMPDIVSYKADIEAAASRAVRAQIRIADIQADWWHLNPRVSLRGLTLAPPGQPVTLSLARVDATLSWLSLALLEPHLSRLDIQQASLEIRRDATGKLFVAGLPVDSQGTPNPFPDWLLRQKEVTLSDGRLIWLDEMRGAPPLALEHVNLLVENLFGRHRFGLVAEPPAEAGRHLDLRGELRGGSVHDIASWSGRLYATLQGASATGLTKWSPWSQSAVRRSTGDLRFWMDVGGGQIKGVVGDVAMRGVAVSLADELPDMVFDQVSGRMGWQRKGAEQTYFVEKLVFVTPDGHSAEPPSVRVTVKPTAAGKVETAKIEADSLRLEALTALSGSLPLPKPAHDWIADFNPRGFVEHMAFDWLGKQDFHVQARFREGGLNAGATLPGFSGLSGEIDADPRQGRVQLNSQAFHFVLDRVFRQPLDFNRFDAELSWNGVAEGGYHFKLVSADLGNADLDGHAEGELTWRPGQAPVIDMTAHLSRGNGNAVWRYLPRTVSDDAYTWVKDSISAGVSPDTRLVLRGPLDRFPFDQGGGQFQVDVQMRNAVLDYAPGWPHITGINGLLTFKDKGMHIVVENGDILGARLGKVRADIPDLHHAHEEFLVVDGLASGATPAFLDFVRQSPVNEHSGHFVDTLNATGRTDLHLHLDMPLRHVADTRVAGRITLTDNQVQLGGKLPSLSRVNGNLGFTGEWIRGNAISAQMFGQPVSVSLASETGGKVRATAKGSLSAATLAQWLPATLAKRISGTTQAQAEVTLRQHEMTIDLKSDLAGLAIDLPAPIGKRADLAVPTSISGHDSERQPTVLNFRYGALLSGAMALPEQGAARLGVTFGGDQASLPKEPGLFVQGSLRQLDLDAWRALDLKGDSGDADSLPVRDISLSFNELKAFGRRVREIHVRAHPEKATWHVKLAGQNMMGEVEYGPRPDQPGSRFAGRFSKLAIPEEESVPGTTAQDPSELPAEVDLNAQSFSIRGHDLGSLNLSFRVEKNGLRIDALKLNNPDGRLESGGWLSASPLRTTELDLKVNSGNLGKLMKRLGYTEAVKGGELAVAGKLTWLGRPEDFAIGLLGGHLDVNVKNGRFTQLDPGAGKLLGILSLQALPRRIVLDFRDVFSEGFAFDEIKGDVYLERGVGYLPGLSINGPAAKIQMNGKIDLVREGQELRLTIQPRLDEGVAVGAGLLGGPAVAVGAYVAAKILKDPFAKAASFEYMVTGSWDDPKVKKLPRNGPAAPAAALPGPTPGSAP
ncbi:TIGR02099 family protein [Parasulfuritortus cantonensis]|uniref:TIGR02099 family protein n=1 Tax=Parasulfuritortus cantonensis TaxID=2528202 RepID=A0A4R1B8G2_9PROT|nr:YhdP family protein [Parasulfuritortus cantonensis]TCJ12279.1 TIGR02099 family protein [Parasulfuritortus cantonensis]